MSILKNNILISGLPRSGSTWLANVLSYSKSVQLVHEPDNCRHNLLGYIYKRNLHRFPYLCSQDINEMYYALFDKAFSGHTLESKDWSNKIIKRLFGFSLSNLENRIQSLYQSNHYKESIKEKLKIRLADLFMNATLNLKPKKKFSRVIVKSVHSLLALEFIEHNFNPTILIILRHPANMLSSYKQMNLNDSWRNIFVQERLVQKYFKDKVDHINQIKQKYTLYALQISAIYYVLEQQIKNHPNWIVLNHEEMIKDPLYNFQKLYSKLNLTWSNETEKYIKSLNKTGTRYSINRKIEDLHEKYKNIFNEEELEQIKAGYSMFSLTNYQDFIN